MAFDRTADELVSAETEGNGSRIEAITLDPQRRR